MAGGFQPIFGKRLRITKLDECGNPSAPGDCGFVVTKGFVSLSLSSDVESGNEIVTRTADGDLCVNERQADSFKRFTLEITWCGVDPCILDLVTNATPYEDAGGDVAGIVVPEGKVEGKFALEMWTGLAGQQCEPGVEEASGYLLLPFVNAGVLGDLEVNGEAAVDFSMTGAFTRGGNNWDVGPFEVVAGTGGLSSTLPTPLDPLDHLLLMQTNIAPPPLPDDNAPCCTPMPQYQVTATNYMPDPSQEYATSTSSSGSTSETGSSGS